MPLMKNSNSEETSRNGTFFVVNKGKPFDMSCSNFIPATARLLIPVLFCFNSPFSRTCRTMSRYPFMPNPKSKSQEILFNGFDLHSFGMHEGDLLQYLLNCARTMHSRTLVYARADHHLH